MTYSLPSPFKADLDPSTGKLRDAQFPDSGQKLINVPLRHVRLFGVKGDGTTDDTTALQNAFNAAVAGGFGLTGDKAARYLVSAAGNKDFMGPAGTVATAKPYAVQMPDGLVWDANGGTLVCAQNANLVVLSNQNTRAVAVGTGDTSTSTNPTQILNVTGTGYAVGQYIHGPNIQFGATITAISGSTITMSKAAVATGTGSAISAGIFADRCDLRNLNVDGGGRSSNGNRTVPMVWFVGLGREFSINNVELFNGNYVGGSIGNCEDGYIDNLRAYAFNGNAWGIGGNTGDRCRRLQIGGIRTWDINTGGTFNQPGNGIFIACDRSTSVKYVYQRNCAGGIKFGPNDETSVDTAYCSGITLNGETAWGTSNSGVKIQGDSANLANTKIGRVVSNFNFGAGFYAWYTGTATVGSISCDSNVTGGVDSDISLKGASVTIGQVVSRNSGRFAIGFESPDASVARFGTVDIENAANIDTANRYAIAITSASTMVCGDLRTVDSRGASSVLVRGINISNAGAIVRIGSHDCWGQSAEAINNAIGASVSVGARKTSQTGSFGNVDIKFYTANATWSKPAGAVTTTIIALGGGGGGGSGRRSASGTAACGGGGGGGGGYSQLTTSSALLGATETVEVGNGGAGGAAVTADSTDGVAGGTGGYASFGAHCRALGGSGGAAGTVNSGTQGSAGSGTTAGGAGGAASTSGGVGGPAGASSGASGGGAGGGVQTNATANAGGNAGISFQAGSAAGGVGGTAAAGGAGTSVTTGRPSPGSGGGGGAGNASGAGFAGGAGGSYGGGGGGGGGSLNGNASGAGGAGAPPFLMVITNLG